jgi:hypothetical protein
MGYKSYKYGDIVPFRDAANRFDNPPPTTLRRRAHGHEICLDTCTSGHTLTLSEETFLVKRTIYLEPRGIGGNLTVPKNRMFLCARGCIPLCLLGYHSIPPLDIGRR